MDPNRLLARAFVDLFRIRHSIERGVRWKELNKEENEFVLDITARMTALERDLQTHLKLVRTPTPKEKSR